MGYPLSVFNKNSTLKGKETKRNTENDRENDRENERERKRGREAGRENGKGEGSETATIMVTETGRQG